MTGLLIKDWKLFKNQGRYLCSMLIIAMAILLVNSEEFTSFAVSYVTFFIAYFALSTISYDEYENGMSFLMTLPISRRIYVSEKYLLTVLLTGGAWLFALGINLIFFQINFSSEAMQELLCTAPAFLLAVLAFLSISLPLFLKFGPEKGRMISFGILGAVFLAIVFLGKMGIGIDHLKELDKLSTEQPEPVFGICIFLSVLFVSVSYFFSLKLMDGKEL